MPLAGLNYWREMVPLALIDKRALPDGMVAVGQRAELWRRTDELCWCVIPENQIPFALVEPMFPVPKTVLIDAQGWPRRAALSPVAAETVLDWERAGLLRWTPLLAAYPGVSIPPPATGPDDPRAEMVAFLHEHRPDLEVPASLVSPRAGGTPLGRTDGERSPA